MKGNMKKLTVIVVVVTIATFVSAAMTLACDKDFDKDSHHGRKAIHGEYGATSVGSCLMTPYGFDEKFVPNPPASAASWGMTTGQAIYTFNRDGTGMVESWVCAITIVPNQRGSSIYETMQFTYDVTDDGIVTIHTVLAEGEYLAGPLKGLKYTIVQGLDKSGYISQDHKTITLATPTAGVQQIAVKNYPVTYALCNYSQVLTRVDK